MTGMTMWNYQGGSGFFATTARGMEPMAAEEIAAQGATHVRRGFQGVRFDADTDALYRVHYNARLVSRILAPLGEFPCPDQDALYREIHALPWPRLFGIERTFAIKAHLNRSKLNHAAFAALKTKDALVDRFREDTGDRPSVDTRQPDIALVLHVENNRATIYLDLAAHSLHRRGYRVDSVDAPLQETLAAAMIRLSGWDGTRLLVDPMCGSGTLLCEALMHHAHIPAGYLRTSCGLERLPDFDTQQWEHVRLASDTGILRFQGSLPIYGSDILPEAVHASRTNLDALPGGPNVRVEARDFRDQKGWNNAVVICNPPYGIRLGDRDGAKALLRDFGALLKHQCKGCSAFVYLGEPGLLGSLGLRPDWQKPLRNGGLDGVLSAYTLY